MLQAQIPYKSNVWPSCQVYSGLGCDLTTFTCVSPCGSAGDVCCDGPDTRALRWTSNTVYSPTGPTLKEMCFAGYCDKNSHKCIGCISTAGSVCCPPDASQATARCIRSNLNFDFADISSTSGNCISCDVDHSPPCREHCGPGLVLRNGVCYSCGNVNQDLCNDGEYNCNYGCKWPGLIAVNGICALCGDLGQIQCRVPPTDQCIKSTNWYC